MLASDEIYSGFNNLGSSRDYRCDRRIDPERIADGSVLLRIARRHDRRKSCAKADYREMGLR